ncbi:uncharacterized protein [Nicotiana sylvestris]|uniref:uncharacterized protein n=1 Tax=Nicotiana sylvestris TaxID=4096 RepID=UPI00388CC58B
MFGGTSDRKVNLRTYCEKLVGVGKNEWIRMKLFIRSLTGDALSWYISQNPKKWVNWVIMASYFMDRFRFNIENTPDIFYIQNLKKKPMETFCEYATRWRSEAAKVRPSLEEEQMNTFFIRAQDPQYYEWLIVIKNHKFSDIIKLGKRIKEGIKSGMAMNFKALQATNKALQSGGISKKKEVGAWINPNKTCAYHSGMKGYTIDECRTLKDKIQTLIDTKVIQAKEAALNVHNNPLPDYREAKSKEKAKMEETGAAQGMTRTGRVYIPKHLGRSSKQDASKPPVVETGPDDLWRKLQAREYSMVDHLNKTPAQISILSLLQNSETHRNALMKVLSEAYVSTNITSGEMSNMVEHVLESHKITFREDELPPEGLSHNIALHITVQFEDKFIVKVLIDRGSSLKICPLTTMKRLGKGLHEIRAGSMNIKAFDGSQRATIGEINLSLQIGPTWSDIEFQVLDISTTYNLLLARPWIHAAGAVTSTLHQAVKF